MPHSTVAGIIGSAAALPERRFGGMAVVKEFARGRIFAGPGARIISGEQAVCVVLGTPRLKSSGFGDNEDSPDTIEPWQAVLLGPTSAIDGRIGGHFGLIYVDLTSGRVLLVADRFASYSIYYRPTDDGIAFADKADLLFDEKPSLSAQALFDYLYFHCLPGPGTVHNDIERLEAGEIVSWQARSVTRTYYWHRNKKGRTYEDFGEASRDFHRLLRSAVANEVDTDATGAFLSGGTDSSTVIGLLAESSGARIKSYSIGFDVDGYDEVSYARLAAERFGTDHRIYYVTPDDLVAHIPSVAAHLDQPFGNSSLLPAMICAERAREDGVTKLLAGDGGDELFGGNTRYAKQKIFEWYRFIPIALRKAILEPLIRPPISGRVPLLSKVKSYVEQANVPLPGRLETYNTLMREGLGTMLPRSLLMNVDTTYPSVLQQQVWDGLTAETLVEKMLEFDWKFTLGDNDLRKIRYASEMSGVRIGFPLLTDELVDFSLRLSPDWKVKNLKLRWFFKRALVDFLPREIIRKKKHGFGLPFGAWALEHAELRRMTTDAIEGLVERGILRASYARRLIDERLPAYPSYYGELVWVLMMLELWLQNHSPDWRVEC